MFIKKKKKENGCTENGQQKPSHHVGHTFCELNFTKPRDKDVMNNTSLTINKSETREFMIFPNVTR